MGKKRKDSIEYDLVVIECCSCVYYEENGKYSGDCEFLSGQRTKYGVIQIEDATEGTCHNPVRVPPEFGCVHFEPKEDP